LFLGGELTWLPHEAISPSRVYQIVIAIDSGRTLTIKIDGKKIVHKKLAENLNLSGPVILGGGIGHVIYKSVTITYTSADNE
jgi:hypothetical protein